ncbi:MAG TPA: RidA family protein [Candidatus Limnocylindria bacterium]|nr:RidA family protein [Candidatus Limnocylindria bacterium]
MATNAAPAAIGPYSQGIRMGELVFTAGQIGLDPASGELAEGVTAQAERALRNVAAILDAAGSSLERVVKTTIFLADMNDFNAVNEVYATHFATPYPARSTVAVAGLPRGALIEIEAIALAGEG